MFYRSAYFISCFDGFRVEGLEWDVPNAKQIDWHTKDSVRCGMRQVNMLT
jgi:hypothetical protein